MRKSSLLISCQLLLVVLISQQFLGPLAVAADQHERKTYIVYMGSHLPSRLNPKSFYDKMMKFAIGREYSNDPSEYLLHTYQRSFHGCAVRLTDVEAQIITGIQGVISVFPNEKLKVHTTRSWDFMSFPVNVERSPIERDLIVGVIDTGIWPENPSFRHTGLGPVPARWKGICQTTSDFACNKKIIGARFYKADRNFSAIEGPTPRDVEGHGTHTASTVAGELVTNASFGGLGSGTARGGVPAARISVYKVCWFDGCDSADILKAFDDAIADGVDVISMSVGGKRAIQYFVDTTAIGAYHAMQKGIFVSMSAGNEGPNRGTVSNVAPWFMSVAATTIDRKFLTNVELGNGKLLQGKLSLNTFEGKKFPMIYGGDAPNSSFPSGARSCSSLNATLVKGKIVLCDLVDRFDAAQATFDARAAGTIMHFNLSNNFVGTSVSFPLPSTIVGLDNGDTILSYIKNSSGNPMGTILKSDPTKDKLAPYVASFSSRGPNIITPTILKPDLSAPGVDILAAYSPKGDISSLTGDTRSIQYSIISGTSMACPHASAAALYVKSFHPDWSPAAIRSALMTTAIPLSASIDTEAELAYGAGHISPKRAVNPGLVYEAVEADYINFLCNQNFTLKQIKQISGTDLTSCPRNDSGFVGDLNYPTITVVSTNSTAFDKIFQRRVKNVGKGSSYKSVYKVKVTAPTGVSVRVKPETLRFTHSGQELSYTVRVKGGFGSSDEVISASIEWFDGVHKVRSPIVAFQSI